MTKAKTKIPRPANSFLQFRGAEIRLMQKANGDGWHPRMASLSKEIGQKWKDASKQYKAIFIAKALKAKEEHKRAYPNYQYHPRKKSKKTADANLKTEDVQPSFSTSPLSSMTSSSASTPAPTTPDATMLANGPSSSGDASDFDFGKDFLLNHHVPFGLHATGQLPHVAQPDSHSWSSQLAGWTDQPLLPSASSTSIQNHMFSLPFQGEEMWEDLFRTQPQAFPPLAAGLQLPTGVMNQQAPQQVFNQMITPSQEHMGAAPSQPQTEALFDGAHNAELEAWNKEFAPLDAGFCDFLSAWNNVNASAAAAASAADSSAPSLTCGAPPVSASLPPTAVYNLNVDEYHAEPLQSQTQGPALPTAPGCIDPSFLFAPDASAMQFLQMFDPFQALPPSAVWPEELNPFGIQM
ncbi:hypothetical protein LXA43DRAFT_1091959 [Ganoderma leucocontextum]|nr:hypothetical protein LXA43DRAFT_1091959 [Ganoderma leucocontextum]